MRARVGKSARLTGVDFDKENVNLVPEVEKPAKTEEAKDSKIEEEAREQVEKVEAKEPAQEKQVEEPKIQAK